MVEISRQMTLLRFAESPQGTLGIITDGIWTTRTIELPWKDNEPNISCIPQGEYVCKLRYSKKFGWTYHVKDVPGRSWILLHSGNVAGDKSIGLKTHSYGCILTGKYFGKLWNQDAVLLSRVTLRQFMDYHKKESFKLVIQKV